MDKARVFQIDVDAEVNRLFDSSSIPADGKPSAVIVMGGVATGKTTLRKQKYMTGHVLVDAADIFISLSRGEYFDFPEAFREPMELIGRLVARRALSERRSIVTEIVGAELEPVQKLVEVLKAVGYSVCVANVACDTNEALRRNFARGENNISAYYAEPFQIAWILDACGELTENVRPDS